MIYVVGSLNMDMAARLPHFPKAGETLAADELTIGPGGKGANQAAAIGKLGGQCAMIGKTGDDAFGKAMRENLRAYGVRTDFVTTAAGSSGLALIWVHKGNNRIVLHKGANDLLTCDDVREGLADAKAGDILLVQLEVPLSVVAYALKTGARKGMITVCNPAPAVPLPSEIYEYSEIIAPNETETEILTGVRPDCEVNAALAVKALRQKGARNVVLTLGAQGSAVAVGNDITLLPACKVKAVDTTAAGDTFLGATAVRLSQGETLTDAARFATYASGLKVTRRGATVAIPTLDEVQAFIQKSVS